MSELGQRRVAHPAPHCNKQVVLEDRHGDKVLGAGYYVRERLCGQGQWPRIRAEAKRARIHHLGEVHIGELSASPNKQARQKRCVLRSGLQCEFCQVWRDTREWERARMVDGRGDVISRPVLQGLAPMVGEVNKRRRSGKGREVVFREERGEGQVGRVPKQWLRLLRQRVGIQMCWDGSAERGHEVWWPFGVKGG